MQSRMLSVMRFYQSVGERAGVSRSSGYRVAVPAFASPERRDTHVLQWPAYEDMGVVCHCMRPPAFWLVACLHPPPRAQGVTGPPYKGPGSIPPKRCLMVTHLFTGLVPRIMRTITSQRGLWWEPRAVRAFGGGSSNLMR